MKVGRLLLKATFLCLIRRFIGFSLFLQADSYDQEERAERDNDELEEGSAGICKGVSVQRPQLGVI